MWDFSIQIDHVIETRRWDLVEKRRRTCKSIDFAVLGDSSIEEKEKERIEKYQQKLWNMRVKIIPLAVDSLGATPKQFGNRLKDTRITSRNMTQCRSNYTAKF